MGFRLSGSYGALLAAYLPVAVAVAAGLGAAARAAGRLARAGDGAGRAAGGLVLLLGAVAIVAPHAATRWQALRTGSPAFVEDRYAFPVDAPGEPRRVAETYLAGLPSDAVLLLSWKCLYSVAYVAHVERRQDDILLFEAMPRTAATARFKRGLAGGTRGAVAESLVEEVVRLVGEGRPAYADADYPGLERAFMLEPTASGLRRLVLAPRVAPE